MKLSKIAVILFAVFAVAFATLYLTSPDSGSRDVGWNQPNPEAPDTFPELNDFFLLLHEERSAIRTGLNNIRKYWQPGNAILLLEMLDWLKESPIKPAVEALLVEKLNLEKFDPDEIRRRIWSVNVIAHPEYADFRKRLTSQIDPRFGEYFDNHYETGIRLDEIRWGGVLRDGIPPLVNPAMLTVDQADYLDDSNVVFGIEINGDARAYPKRILAWHEMFRDTVGDEPVAGVYCTLCGTMILFKTATGDGGQFTLGTSGFLYRSNKLMYDHATKSLWSTMLGEPVTGPLVGKGIKLPQGSVVTTDWGTWRKRHPETKVLSLETGHRRDYGEGKAYDFYFGNDKIMFVVPKSDMRLKNKAEVLAIRASDAGEPLAISADFLLANPVYQDRVGDRNLVVLTDSSGANRVYERKASNFTILEDAIVRDESGNEWTVSETRLTFGEQVLNRLPAHRSFWFGWYNAFPNTRLVQ